MFPCLSSLNYLGIKSEFLHASITEFAQMVGGLRTVWNMDVGATHVTAKSPSKYFFWRMTQTLQTYPCLLLEARLFRQGSRSVQLGYYTQDLTATSGNKQRSRLQCRWIFTWGESYPWQFIYIIIHEYNWSLPCS